IGSLSTAVSETTVMSDAIPANVRLLDELPAQPESAPEAVTEAPDGEVQDAAAQGDEASASEVAGVEIPAPVELRALQYSFGWAAWETVIDLSPVIIASALSPD